MSAQEFILIPKENYIKNQPKASEFWTIQQLQQKVNNLRYYSEFTKKGGREGKNVSRSESPRDTGRYPEEGTSLNHNAQSSSN